MLELRTEETTYRLTEGIPKAAPVVPFIGGGAWPMMLSEKLSN